MFKKFALILAIVAIATLVATAGTVPTETNYKVVFATDSVVKGTPVKAGEYRLSLLDTKITLSNGDGKKLVEAVVQVQMEQEKFDSTTIRCDTATGKSVVSEIRLGGTKTRLILN